MSDAKGSSKTEADEASAEGRRAERDRLCRELADFVDECRESDDPATLERLRATYRASMGAVVAWDEQRSRRRLAVKFASLLLPVARWRLAVDDPKGFEATVKAIPAWLARECAEPAFENAQADGHVLKIAMRRDKRDPARGSLSLVALLALRTGALDARTIYPLATRDPYWYDAEVVADFVRSLRKSIGKSD